ncbi:MAG TPA: phage major tail tube protein [Clostridia bacterium]
MILSGSVIAHKVFDDGIDIDDNVSCQLPKVEFGTTEIKGAGILGAFEMPSTGQLNAMAFSLTQRSINKNSINLSRPGQHNIELRFVKDARTSDGQQIPQGTKIFLTGLTKSFDPGKVEENATMDGSIEYEVLRIRIIIAGEEVLLIDKINYIYKVNGKDYMEGIREALK